MRRWRGQTFSDFVYVITGSHGMTKIGVSANPVARLAALQTGSAHHLVLAHAVPINGDAYAAEAEAHALLARYRQIGEWFAVPAEVAVAAVSAAAFKFSQTDGSVKEPRWWLRYMVFTALATPVWMFSTPVPFFFVGLAVAVWMNLRMMRTRGGWSLCLGVQWAGVAAAAILTSLLLAMPFVSAHAEQIRTVGPWKVLTTEPDPGRRVVEITAVNTSEYSLSLYCISGPWRLFISRFSDRDTDDQAIPVTLTYKLDGASPKTIRGIGHPGYRFEIHYDANSFVDELINSKKDLEFAISPDTQMTLLSIRGAREALTPYFDKCPLS